MAWTIKKKGFNYGLYHNGKLVDELANRATAEKYKALHEKDDREKAAKYAAAKSNPAELITTKWKTVRIRKINGAVQVAIGGAKPRKRRLTAVKRKRTAKRSNGARKLARRKTAAKSAVRRRNPSSGGLNYKLESNGGFIVGNLAKRWAAYAYPSSPLAARAAKSPDAVAREMAKDMNSDLALAAKNQTVRDAMDRQLRKLI